MWLNPLTWTWLGFITVDVICLWNLLLAPFEAHHLAQQQAEVLQLIEEFEARVPNKWIFNDGIGN